MAISSEDISAVLEKLDFLNLVQEHIPLRRVGNRYVGLCPFHSESTPSFSVNPSMGVYYCFGCHASGDAITFVRNVDRLDFADAVEQLAQRVGITITRDSTEDSTKRNQVKSVRETLRRAVEYYHNNLRLPEFEFARNYLESRGIESKLWDDFQVGVASSDSSKLSAVLRVPNEIFTASGLGYIDSRGRARDMFAGRLVFPIFDQSGNPVAFGGRVLPGVHYPGEGEPAKYKNSPETEIYAKRRVLYGLNWAKSHIVHQDRVVICEGYTDVIAFFGANLPIAVATCGTALTEEHIDRLKNFSRNVVLAFDGDKAGSNATERIYEWERKYSLNIRVASFPEGADPSSLRDPELLAVAVSQAKPFLSFRLERLVGSKDLSSIEGRVNAANAALELVAQHPNPMVRAEYLMMVGDLCKLDVKELDRTLDQYVKLWQSRSRQAQVNTTSHVDSFAPSETNSSSLDQAEDPALQRDVIESAINELLEPSLRPYNEALRILLQNPSGLAPFIPEYLFSNSIHVELVKHIVSSSSKNEIVATAVKLSPKARGLLMRLVAVPSEIDEVDAIARLLEHHAGRMVDDMVRQIRSSPSESEDDKAHIIGVSETLIHIRRMLARTRDQETRDDAVGELLAFFAQTYD